MKGLLMKDFLLMLQQKRFFILLLFVTVMLGVSSDGSFIISYLTFVCAIFVLSTISYDEYDNGYSFLMTLPIERKDYVRGKYLFGVLVSGVAWIVGIVIAVIAEVAKGKSFVYKEMLCQAGICFLIALVLLAVMLPIQLKFGGEKGRLMMFVVFACSFFVGFFIVRVAEWQKVDIAELSQMFSKIPMICLAGILLLATILCVGISYIISCKIMNKKEF